MIYRLLYLFVILVFFGSCGTTKRTVNTPQRKITVKASPVKTRPERNSKTNAIRTNNKANKIINTALKYSGVRYKYGGTTKKGMDCSGLLYVAFNEHNVSLPRVSYVMAEKGKRIRVSDVTKGDLLFFKTNKSGKRINHVGLVVAIESNTIKFVHATSSRGVIVSSLREGYWNSAFIKATRVLN